MLLMQTIVVDARAHMLGRLASILAKQLLGGQQVVSSTTETPSSSSPWSTLKARLPIKALLQHHTCLASKTWHITMWQPVAILCQPC